MKAKTIGIVILAFIALGSIGCSSDRKIYYWMGKSYVRNPETEEWMSRKYKMEEGTGRGGPYPAYGYSMGWGGMSGFSPKINCSDIQVPCSIK